MLPEEERKNYEFQFFTNRKHLPKSGTSSR